MTIGRKARRKHIPSIRGDEWVQVLRERPYRELRRRSAHGSLPANSNVLGVGSASEHKRPAETLNNRDI
jgi:hypothetical protein